MNTYPVFPSVRKDTADDGMAGKDIRFDRTRRITGYLVGSLDRFNNAKRAEEKDRLKHGM